MVEKETNDKKEELTFADSSELFESILREANAEIQMEKKKVSAAPVLKPEPKPEAKPRLGAKPMAPAKLELEPVSEAKPGPEQKESPEAKPRMHPSPPKPRQDIVRNPGPRTSMLAIFVVALLTAAVVGVYFGIIDVGGYLGSPAPLPPTVTSPPPAPPAVAKEETGASPPPQKVEAEPTPASVQAPAVTTKAQAPQPDSQPKEAAAAGTAPPAAGSGVSYPYSVYLGSVQGVEYVKRAMSSYGSQGLSIYWSKVDLGAKGTWYRLFAGYFRNAQEAETFIQQKRIKDGEVKETRYSNLLGTFETKQAGEERALALASLGLNAYWIPAAEGQVRVYSGAFITREGAEKNQAELNSKGVKSEIVER